MDGALIIDKPAGMTSHDVVSRVRKTIGERRVGHTGTLDPFATGVLVVLVGRATRLAQFLSGAEKEYEAVIRLGFATDTGDVTGKRIDLATNFNTEIPREDIEAALASLRGEMEQTPPMYSAKKVAGRKLYELARRGEEVERRSVRVNVSEFEAITHNGTLLQENDDGCRDLRVRVVCSAGTYVRTLAEDFGQRLGVGAHVASLRRTRAGQFKIADAITLERLGKPSGSSSIESILISATAAVSHLPQIQLNADDVLRTVHGINMQIEDRVSSDWPGGQPVRMCDADGNLIAVGIYAQQEKTIHPSVVIAGND